MKKCDLVVSPQDRYNVKEKKKERKTVVLWTAMISVLEL